MFFKNNFIFCESESVFRLRFHSSRHQNHFFADLSTHTRHIAQQQRVEATSLPPSLYCLSTHTYSHTNTNTHTHTHRVRPAVRPPPSLLLPSTNNNYIIVSSRDTTTPSRPRAVSPLFLSGSEALVRLLPAFFAPFSLAVVLADA